MTAADGRDCGEGDRPALTGFEPDEMRDCLVRFLTDRGEPAYRVDQMVDWIYRRGVRDFEGMSNLPRRLRADLAISFRVYALRPTEEVGSNDGARKYLFLTDEGHPVESVRLPVPDGETLCLSVSSGCPLACAFCASGRFHHRALRGGEGGSGGGRSSRP